jgi:two-component system sensor kinase FixL
VLVRADLVPGADSVLVDRVQIQQVLLNLMRNAIEAMADSQSVQRELRISTRLSDEGMVEISVADTGQGISPSVAEQLFRPFVTTKRHGMGVGLSISRTIVEAHGGRLWVEPNPDGGAIFRLTVRAFVEPGEPDER